VEDGPAETGLTARFRARAIVFFADMEGTDGVPGLRQTIRTRQQPEKSPLRGGGETIYSDEILFLPDLPGVGSFFVQARRLDLPPGFRMTWKTRALVP